MTAPNNHRRNFLDLHQFISGLTGEKMSLEAAGKALGLERGKVRAEQHGLITPEYVEYNRRDVEATFELCLKALEEYDRHPFSPGNPAPGYKRPETLVYSTASMTKAYLTAMGILPPMQKNPNFPKEVLGASMEAFYGGRAEPDIIRCVVPVVHTDFTSQYPTACALMGLWKLLIAEQVEVVEATDEVRGWLDGLRPADLMRPEAWPALVGIALGQPTKVDLLPVRAPYGREDPGGDDPYHIALAHPVFDRPVWYALADLAASKVLTGRSPEVSRALRFAPVGTQAGLRPARIRGAVEVDPVLDDFFCRLIEERARVGRGLPPYDGLNALERKWLRRCLKTLANSIYGVLVEINKQRLPQGKRVRVRVWHGQGSYVTSVGAVEEPGRFFFPPLGAIITAAGRLMLALLEWNVRQHGGAFAFCDTDSMAIVASERGGIVEIEGQGNGGRAVPQQIRALSWQEVEAIEQAFESLSPYDREAAPGSILKIEDVNFRDGRQIQLHVLVAGTKRYAVFERLPNDDLRITDQYSQHGLGHVVSPTEIRSGEDDWRRRVWDYIVRRELGLPANLPEWADLPAVGRHAITTWHLMRPFERFNRGKPYKAQVKPFNFMLTAQHDPFAASRFKDGLRLIGPFEPDPRQWLKMKWLNLHGGEVLRLSRGPYVAKDEVRYQSYGDLIAAHPYHRETKRTGPDGLPCEERTKGVLGRRIVRPLRMDRIGKEADRHEERDLAMDLDDLIANYGGIPGEIEKHIIRPALGMWLREVAGATGIDLENLRKIAGSKRKMLRTTSRRIVVALAATCAAELKSAGVRAPRRHLAAIKLYLDLHKILREKNYARLASMEAELAHLEAEQRTDPHTRFRYWHDLTDCWKRTTVRTRYRRATVNNPRGQRSSWAKPLSVEGILSEACAEMGENFETFSRRVCRAVHERPGQIMELKRTIRTARDCLAKGRPVIGGGPDRALDSGA